MPPETKTILFAEDEEAIRGFVLPLLRQNGYEVILAEDGMDALRKARQHTGQIHLLLSNVQMPGMTGIELATQLQIESPNTAVLLISGTASGMIVLDTGWDFLPKPFLPRMLVEKIESILDRRTIENIGECRPQREDE
jgi:DNA-binding response OmpR family regulator